MSEAKTAAQSIMEQAIKGGVEPVVDKAVTETKTEETKSTETTETTAAAETPKTESSPDISTEDRERFNSSLEKVKEDEANKGKTEQELESLALKSIATQPEKTEEKENTAQEIDWAKEISSKTEGKYKSFGELVEAANKTPEVKEVELSDRVKKLKELEEKGVDIEQVLLYQSLKVDDLRPDNPEEAKRLLKIKMSTEETSLTEQEMDAILSKEYGTDEYGDAEDNVLAKINLKRDATKAKAELQAKGKDLELPSQKVTNSHNAEEAAKKAAEAKANWDRMVGASLEGYTNETFALEGENKLEYTFNGEHKSAITELMTTPMKRYTTADGQVDMTKYRRDMLIIHDMENILKAAHSKGENAAYEKFIRDLKNPRQKGSAAPVSKESGSLEHKMLQKAAKNLYR